jgi:hypothetical protein
MGVLNAGSVSAQAIPACQTGKLVGFDTRTTTIQGARTGHYEEREKASGKKVFDGYSYSGDQTQVIYVLTVTIGDLTYTAEHIKMIIFGYNPTDMVVNDPVTVCVEKNKLVFTRREGKKYKTAIVRIERNAQLGE